MRAFLYDSRSYCYHNESKHGVTDLDVKPSDSFIVNCKYRFILYARKVAGKKVERLPVNPDGSEFSINSSQLVSLSPPALIYLSDGRIFIRDDKCGNVLLTDSLEKIVTIAVEALNSQR